VGRNIFEFFIETGRLKKISMMHLISSQNINFLGKGFLACMCSLALIVAGATSFYLRGEKNFGVDFRGGDLITLSSPQAIDVGKVRAALQPINLADATIQESNQGGKYYITIRTPLHTSDAVEKQIMTAMPEAQFKVEGAERVGARVGGERAQRLDRTDHERKYQSDAEPDYPYQHRHFDPDSVSLPFRRCGPA